MPTLMTAERPVTDVPAADPADVRMRPASTYSTSGSTRTFGYRVRRRST